MIDLLPTSEQEEISGAVAEFLGNELPITRLRRTGRATPNRDRILWPQMGALGFFGLGLDEDLGGVGYTMVEEVLAFREFGRYAVSPSVLASVVGARIASVAGRGELARAILTGATVPGLVLPWSFLNRGQASERCYLIEADGADHVVAWTVAGAELWAMTGIASDSVEPFDSSLTMAEATIAKPAAIVPNDATEAIGLRATLLTAAMLVGLAEAACAASVDYAKLREQFGQPIGSFQAVKHRCSDMVVRAELAWSQVRFATLALQTGVLDARFQVSAAKLLAGEAGVKNGQANIQNHGAIAITAEIDAHIYLKRSHLLDRLGGDQYEQQQLLMRQPAPA